MNEIAREENMFNRIPLRIQISNLERQKILQISTFHFDIMCLFTCAILLATINNKALNKSAFENSSSSNFFLVKIRINNTITLKYLFHLCYYLYHLYLSLKFSLLDVWQQQPVFRMMMQSHLHRGQYSHRNHHFIKLIQARYRWNKQGARGVKTEI